MMKLFYPVVVFGMVCFFAACKTDTGKKIGELEMALEKQYTPGRADSLVGLYLAAVKANPDAHAINYNYLTKAAAIKLVQQRKDGNSIARWLDEAINTHGKGQSLTDAVELLSRLWNAYTYKSEPAVNMDPDDIDKMHANLLKSLNWMDSSLVRLDKAMRAGKTGEYDKKLADAFIDISEAQAGLLQELNQTDRYAAVILTAAGLAKTIGNPNKALQLYYKVEHYMPSHPKAPTALFMTGFIYENDLHDLEKAKSTYEEFLERYSDDPDYADDAKQALKMLGKSPEELVKEFEKNNRVQ